MKHFVQKLFNRSIKHRLVQLTNTAIVDLMGRYLEISHVVGYPKCGGSWLRNMLQDYQGGPTYLVDRLVYRGMVIQVHRMFSTKYCNPVVIIRDPRDMYVSFYYHERRYSQEGQRLEISKYFQHDPERPDRDDFAAYLEAKLLHRTDPGFSYHDFIYSWMDHPEIHMLKYGSLLDDTIGEMSKIIEYLGWALDRDRLNKVVDFHNFENVTKRLYGVARKPGEQDVGKFQRKGVVGDWKNYFNAHSCELIQQYEGDTLQRAGFESDPGWVQRFLSQDFERGAG